MLTRRMQADVRDPESEMNVIILHSHYQQLSSYISYKIPVLMVVNICN